MVCRYYTFSYLWRVYIPLESTQYVLWENALFKRGIDGRFLKCVDKEQHKKLFSTFHDQSYGGNFSSAVTIHKILRVGYYWPTLFRDASKWVGKGEAYQTFTGRPKLASLPLNLVVIDEPFQQWGLDFIGTLNPPSSVGHTHVLTVTKYFNKWVDTIPVKITTSEVVCNFIKEKISIRFGVPNKIVIDNASNFYSSKMMDFCYSYGISLSHF